MKLFKDAFIYDGTGAEAFRGDILVDNDRIVKVSDDIHPEEGWEVVNLKGLSVAPGFMDAHSHNDWFAIKNEPQKYFEPFIRQGITSFVAGNCGLSAIGFEADSQHVDKVGGGLFLDKRMATQQALEATKKRIEWGSQIRSYVFDDRRVKDHRTGYQTSNVDAVMDGDIDGFIKEYLLQY